MESEKSRWTQPVPIFHSFACHTLYTFIILYSFPITSSLQHQRRRVIVSRWREWWGGKLIKNGGGDCKGISKSFSGISWSTGQCQTRRGNLFIWYINYKQSNGCDKGEGKEKTDYCSCRFIEKSTTILFSFDPSMCGQSVAVSRGEAQLSSSLSV